MFGEIAGIFESNEQDYEIRRPDVSKVEQQVGAKRLRVGIKELSV